MTEHKAAEERAREIVAHWMMQAWVEQRPRPEKPDVDRLVTAITAAITAAEERGKAEALADIEKRGLCIVPTNPDRTMYDAGRDAMEAEQARVRQYGCKTQYYDTLAIIAYRAMISAAPK